jgi:HEAT repeat protein
MKRFLGLVGLVLWATMTRGADVGDLIKQLKDADNDGRRAAAKALGEGGPASKSAVPALIQALKDKDLYVRRFSAEALGDIGPDAQSAVPALSTALNDPKKQVQSAAARALGKLGPSGVETLIELLKNDNKDTAMRRQAIESLSGLGETARAVVPVLTDLIKQPAAKSKKKMAPEDLRADAATALGTLAKSSDKEVVETLEALTEKKAKTPRNLRMAANVALKKIKNKK